MKSLARIGWFAWLGTALVVWFYPVSTRPGRLFLAASPPVLLITGSILLWRRKRLRLVPLVLLAILFCFVLAPGRETNRRRLRDRYVASLKSYEGVRYVWGGENRLGMDCSGLVRVGLIRASLSEAIATLNPRLARTALGLWWHDCTAKALKDEYHDRTRRLFVSPSVNRTDAADIQKGDMAVTVDGMHVLVYLGDAEWVEADPGIGKVIRARVPVIGNAWFDQRVHLVRWRELNDPAR